MATQPVQPDAPVTAAPRQRVRGPIEGGSRIESQVVVAGEPIVIRLEIRAKDGPLAFFVAGDSDTDATFPSRVHVQARDAAGAVVCDNRETYGDRSSRRRSGFERVLPIGETHRETFVLNPACPTLARPGVYRVVLHRRLGNASLVEGAGATGTRRSCDLYPLPEVPLTAEVPPECSAPLAGLPSITTEFEVLVKPYSRIHLSLATEDRLRELSSATPRDDVGRSRVATWVCTFVACDCPRAESRGLTDRELLRALPDALPPSFPRACQADR